VIEAAWPQYTDALATGAEVTLAIQVNGKLRGTLHTARNVSDEALRAHALALPTVAKHVENRVIKSIRGGKSRPSGYPRGCEDKSGSAALRARRVSHYARGRAQVLHAPRSGEWRVSLNLRHWTLNLLGIGQRAALLRGR
jgi:leucyl-tRNA synthetase